MIIFGNFEELQNNDEKLANELLQERGLGNGKQKRSIITKT